MNLVCCFFVVACLGTAADAFSCAPVSFSGTRSSSLTHLHADAADSADAAAASSSSSEAATPSEAELPDSYVRCGKCQTSFALTEADLGSGKGRYVILY